MSKSNGCWWSWAVNRPIAHDLDEARTTQPLQEADIQEGNLQTGSFHSDNFVPVFFYEGMLSPVQ